jgi:hypothetical protein
MSIDYQDRNTVDKINRSEASFIPKYDGKNIAIHIDCLGGDSDFSDDKLCRRLF